MNYNLLSSICKFRTDKISSNNVGLNNYITTENMLPDRGGIGIASNLPAVKSMPAYYSGDILLSNIRPYFKKIWFANKVGGVSNDVLVIKANSSVNKKFLYYVLSDNNFFNYATVTAKGTKMPRGSKAAIMKYLVPDIDMYCQTRIADILSAYDDLIENNNRRIELLEKAAQELYKEWFVRFRFPGHENVKFENGLPVGWFYSTIGSLSEVVQRGISPTYDECGEYTVINQKCIRTNIMDISEARRQSKVFRSELYLKDCDTVICSTGTGTLGRVGQVYGNYSKTTIDSHVTLVRANSQIGKNFMFYSLKNLQPWFVNMGIGSTNQQELYRDTIRRAQILVPTDNLNNLFEKSAQPIHDLISSLTQDNLILIKQRDLLLPRLMNGRLEV